MSRRSNRLLVSGYYRDDEDYATDARTVFYQESPTCRIFKKRTGAKRSYCTLSQASSSHSSLGKLDTVEELSAQSQAFVSSGYCLEGKNDPPAPLITTKLHNQCRSSHFNGFLTAVVYFLTDALMLSRNTRHLRKPVLTTVVLNLLLTLAFGLWIYPSLHSDVSTVGRTIQTHSCTATMVDLDMETVENPWASAQREIAFLKEDRLKQKLMLETLMSELTVLKSTISNVVRDLHVWSAGAERQTSELKTEVFARLEQQLAVVSGSLDTAVQHAELQEVLKALERRLMNNLRHQRSVREKAVSMQVVQDTIQKELQLFRADDVGMLDYALESIGSTIIKSRCSDTYHAKSSYLGLFGIPLFYNSHGPRTIIQPGVYAGKCWAFMGNQGFATIKLAYPVHITHVTLEHLPKELHPAGHQYNAPKEFSVYGMVQADEEGTLLGSFLYNYDGESIQTFEIPESMKGVYSVVQLRVESNWGHPDYTCIYRFRVHEQLRTP